MSHPLLFLPVRSDPVQVAGKHAEVVGGGADKASLLVGSAAFASLGAVSHRFLDALFPVGFFTPAREAEVGGKSAGEVDRFARGVPGEVQVGQEVHICFKVVAVDFDAVRFVVFFEWSGVRGAQ
jgi:hypothetical protein